MRTKIWTKYELIRSMSDEWNDECMQDAYISYYAAMKEYKFVSYLRSKIPGQVIELGNKRYYII